MLKVVGGSERHQTVVEVCRVACHVFFSPVQFPMGTLVWSSGDLWGLDTHLYMRMHKKTSTLEFE